MPERLWTVKCDVWTGPTHSSDSSMRALPPALRSCGLFISRPRSSGSWTTPSSTVMAETIALEPRPQACSFARVALAVRNKAAHPWTRNPIVTIRLMAPHAISGARDLIELGPYLCVFGSRLPAPASSHARYSFCRLPACQHIGTGRQRRLTEWGLQLDRMLAHTKWYTKWSRPSSG